MEAKIDINTFGSKIAALGARLSYENTFKSRYVDIEETFLDATLAAHVDSRLLTAIEHWIYTFGFVIKPSKVKRLIEGGRSYDPAVLGAFCEIIKNNKLKKVNFNCLKPFIKSEDHLTEVLEKPFPTKDSSQDPIWLKYNLSKTKYIDRSEKYLRAKEWIAENIPELKYRIKGISVNESDYNAYKDKEDIGSLYKLAQDIHAHYPEIHRIHNKVQAFNLDGKIFTASRQKYLA